MHPFSIQLYQWLKYHLPFMPPVFGFFEDTPVTFFLVLHLAPEKLLNYDINSF